jgi:hypothetical protein
MAAEPTSGPEVNFTIARVWAIQTNQPSAGQTTVWLGFTSPPWQQNQFENGTLTITGIQGSYPIVANRSQLFVHGYQNFVVVSGLVPASAVKASCVLRDDDARLKTELQLPSLPMDGFGQQVINGKMPVFSSRRIRGLAAVYAPAFIQVVDANQLEWNTRLAIPFFRNKDVFDFGLSGVFDDVKDLTDKDIFWAHTVTFGFQPKAASDGDNNDEALEMGVTPEMPGTFDALGYSAVYEEAVRDYAYEGQRSDYYLPVNYWRLEADYYGSLFGCIAHEVGHAPGSNYEGTDHAEDFLMRKGGDQIKVRFSATSIKRFRTTKNWGLGYR